MQLIILDKNFDTLGIVSVFNTLLWTPRYYDAGVFQLNAPVDYFTLFNTGRYLYRSDSEYLGVIQEVEFSKDSKGAKTALCKGYFAERLLNNRVVNATHRQTGTPEAIGRKLVEDFFISPTDSDRVIPNIKLGTESGIGESTTVSITGDEVGAKLYEIEKTQEMSHRLRYNYLTNELVFETWQGKDRTDSQTENSWAIFSDSFFNIKNVKYNRQDSQYKNYAYVAGEGEDDARTVVAVDIREDASEERLEVYVDARDLQSKYTNSKGEEKSYTKAQYTKMLRQRGLEKLADYGVLESVNSDVDPYANLEYGKDYDLGDLCIYRFTDIGIECVKRITEIQEIFEGSKHTITAVFGTDGTMPIEKLIKREVS